MSETRFKFKKCELLPNEGSSLDEKYELLGGGPIVDYYEKKKLDWLLTKKTN